MKFFITLMALTGLMLFSCKKSCSDDISASLEGTWKMVLVKDNATNVSEAKPLTTPGDVVISFVPHNASTGLFTGKTPTNDFGPNEYSLGPSQTIATPVLTMTKVAETSWGLLFVDNIRTAQQYGFEQGGRLNIRTERKTLTFKKQ